jgi:hypothetical protein
MMHWKLTVNKKEGRLELWQEEQVVASKVWLEERDTSRQVLTALEELRQKAGVTWAEVPILELELDLPEHATARRIAQTIQNTYTTFVAR